MKNKKLQLLVVFLWSFIVSMGQKWEPDMVLVEGGKFKMGSEEGDNDETPVYELQVGDFYISKTEITVGQYREFCNKTSRQMPDPPVWGWHDDYPMTHVTWSDAGAYCLWLSNTTTKKYRLPMEKEWEYAAKGGNKSQKYLFSGSNTVDDVAWFYETTYGSGPQPVGKMKGNELGISDMSGNVWEWCKDSYTLQYFNTSSPNTKGASGENYRVIRGGAWNSSAYHNRITNRDRNIPNSANDNTGFRVVRYE